MARKVVGPTGSRRRRWLFLLCLVVTIGAGVFFIPGALAVHDTGAFQLEGDAQVTTGDTSQTDDWDSICAALPAKCTFQTGVPAPSATSTATAVSFTNDGAQNATIFTTGGSKDPQDISSWKWKDQSGGLPDKDNLEDSFAARYSLTPNPSSCPVVDSLPTCQVLYFGSDRYDNSGDAQQGFWFFQHKVFLATSGPNAGKFVDSHGNLAQHTVGDLLVVSDFSNGGTNSYISVYEWVGTGGNTNGTLDLLGGGNNKECGLASADPYCGIVNSSDGTVAPWTFTDKSGNNTYLQNEFFEGGVNLSALSSAIASECFSSFLSETRSSTSANATLKDFVLGDFGNCEASMETQVSSASVVPGQQVRDTATVTGNQSGLTPDGTVTFSLCSFDSSHTTDLCDKSDTSTVLNGHTGVSAGSGGLSGSGGVATAHSSYVNTAESPLDPGRYCFRAEWPGDSNYTDALTEYGQSTGSNECFTVAKINTSTDTSPSPSTTTLAAINAGGYVTDTATVTGTMAGDDPTGNVNFYVCKFDPGTTDTCDNSDSAHAGTAVTGNPKSLVSDGVSTTYTASATSGQVDSSVVTGVGRYCFRAEYGGSTIYNGSSDDGSNECFTVTDTSSVRTAQKWIPNDSAEITSAGGTALSGNVTFTLYDNATCTPGTANIHVKYGPQTVDVTTGTGTAADRVVSTSNTDTFIVNSANNTGTYSWKVVYAGGDSVGGSESYCEKTDPITITDSAG